MSSPAAHPLGRRRLLVGESLEFCDVCDAVTAHSRCWLLARLTLRKRRWRIPCERCRAREEYERRSLRADGKPSKPHLNMIIDPL